MSETPVSVIHKESHKTLVRHGLNQFYRNVVSLIRRDFCESFSMVEFHRCGFFLDRHLSAMISHYGYWVSYKQDKLVVLEEHSDAVWAAVVSDDNRYLFSGSEDRLICVWDLQTGEIVTKWAAQSTGGIYCMALNKGYLVSGGTGGTLKMWDAYNQKLIRDLKGHSNKTVYSLEFNPCGERFVSGADDNTIREWLTKTGECLRTFNDHSGTIWSVTYLNNEIVISGGGDNTIHVWNPLKNTSDRRVTEMLSTGVSSVSVSMDSSCLLAVCDNEYLIVYNVENLQYECHKQFHGFRACFHPCIPHLCAVSTYADFEIYIMDVRDLSEVRYLDGPNAVCDELSFTSDGYRLIAASDDECVYVWDVCDLMLE